MSLIRHTGTHLITEIKLSHSLSLSLSHSLTLLLTLSLSLSLLYSLSYTLSLSPPLSLSLSYTLSLSLSLLLQVCDDVIYIYFTVEMCIKMFAMGISGKGCYLSETWNRLDCFIVLAG
jgi:hypothetical protein